MYIKMIIKIQKKSENIEIKEIFAQICMYLKDYLIMEFTAC